MKNPIKKLNKFYQISLGIFVILAFVRWVFHPKMDNMPSARCVVSNDKSPRAAEGAALPLKAVPTAAVEAVDTAKSTNANALIRNAADKVLARDAADKVLARNAADKVLASVIADSVQSASSGPAALTQKGDRGKSRPRHRIRGVYSNAKVFPDVQDVQIVAARKNGVRPPRNRQEAERRKDELVYVGCSPYFHLDPSMKSSIPYLVPKASVLLNRIGRNFYDSLFVKGIPLHKVIVSSVLRSQEDVDKLTQTNINANKESCHRYGTTFDICYTRFHAVSPPDGPLRRTVRDDTLMWVLSEVLRDLREQDQCYIKHEAKQSCFHITVR